MALDGACARARARMIQSSRPSATLVCGAGGGAPHAACERRRAQVACVAAAAASVDKEFRSWSADERRRRWTTDEWSAHCERIAALAPVPSIARRDASWYRAHGWGVVRLVCARTARARASAYFWSCRVRRAGTAARLLTSRKFLSPDSTRPDTRRKKGDEL